MKNAFITSALALLLTSNAHAYNSDYPKSREERRSEEMGSILSNGGIVFKPQKSQSNSTKAHSKINVYLWDATVEILSQSPILIKNQDEGVVSTDWYSNKDNPNESSKITVRISGDVISPESIHIEHALRIMKNGRWLESEASPKIITETESCIINRARELYIKSKER
jgi:hypothetical protein